MQNVCAQSTCQDYSFDVRNIGVSVGVRLFVMHFSTSVPMLISRRFGDEVVIANYETGIYYSLAGTAADIWLGIEAGRSIEEIALALSSQSISSQPQAVSVVRAFVDQLLAEGIIVSMNGAPERREWSPMAEGDFSRLALERYDDLRDLLLLDPIHDVAESGWPMRKKPNGS